MLRNAATQPFPTGSLLRREFPACTVLCQEDRIGCPSSSDSRPQQFFSATGCFHVIVRSLNSDIYRKHLKYVQASLNVGSWTRSHRLGVSNLNFRWCSIRNRNAPWKLIMHFNAGHHLPKLRSEIQAGPRKQAQLRNNGTLAPPFGTKPRPG